MYKGFMIDLEDHFATTKPLLTLVSGEISDIMDLKV